MGDPRDRSHRDTVAASTLDSPGPPSADVPLLQRGDAIGRYIVLDRIGEGGMGVVYAAYDPELDRKVAVKLLRPSARGSDPGDRRARLLREAQALARLQHPNVVTVHDVGTRGQHVFIAMELVVGQTLRAWAKAAPRDWHAVLAVYLQAARALAAAHALGIVHRDFKPDNALIDEGGRVRVVDFGLARTSDGDAPATAAPAAPDWEAGEGARAAIDVTLTRTGTLLGTPGYMAPEQHGGRAQASADQFSFCASLFEAIYGELPFSGTSLGELLDNKRTAAPRVPAGKRDVPEWLHEALLRGLRVDPAQRFPSMEALATAIDRDRPPRRWRRAVSLAALGALALTLLVAGAVTWQSRREARRRLARATTLAQTAERVANMMRNTYLLPLHDTRPERDQVRAQMQAVREELRRNGPDGAGLTDLALGLGHLALREFAEARPHLEAAWAAGQRNPEVAFALADCLTTLFGRQRLDLSSLPIGVRGKQLEAAFNDKAAPAIGYLRAYPTTPPEIGQGFIAYLEGRYDDAARLLQPAFARAPAQDDVGRFFAWTVSAQARVDAGTLDFAEGMRRKKIAEEAYHRLQAVMRSSPEAYTEEARFLITFTNGWDGSHDFEPIYVHVIELCDRAAEADPDLWSVPTLRSITHVYRGYDVSRRSRDPRPEYEQAIADATRAIALAPDEHYPYLYRAEANNFLGDEAQARGGDPRPFYRLAIADLERAAQRSSDWESTMQLGEAYGGLAGYEVTIGEDPSADFARAETTIRRMLDVYDGDSRVHDELGSIIGQWASWELEHGRDPRPINQRSQRELLRAAETGPKDGAPRGNLADMLGLDIRWELAHGRDALAMADEAVKSAEQGVALSGAVASLRVSLGEALRLRARVETARHGDARPWLERARNEATRALAIDVNDAFARALRARIDLALGGEANLRQARADVAAVLARNARDNDALALAGDVARARLPRSDECAAVLDRLDHADASSARVLYARAELRQACAAREGDATRRAAALAQAERDRDQALKMDPLAPLDR